MAKSTPIEIKATFLRETVRREGWFAGRVKLTDPKDPKNASFPLEFQINGLAEEDEIVPGLAYNFGGFVEMHPQYGFQFRLETFCLTQPHGMIGVVKYLQEYCEGVGEASAKKLFATYGAETVKVLRSDPEAFCRAIPRFPLEKAKAASEALTELAAMEDVHVDMYTLVSGRGFPRSLARDVIKIWGVSAPERIRRNPFILIEANIRGCGFLRCDQMYQDLKLPLFKIKRIVYCIQHFLNSDREGDTWKNESEIRAFIKGMIGAFRPKPRSRIQTLDQLIDKAIALAERSGKIRTRKNCSKCEGTGKVVVPDLFLGDPLSIDCQQCKGSGGLMIAEKRKAISEEFVACKFAAMSKWENHWPAIEGEAFEKLTDEQRIELSKALSQATSILTGGPGTGKSFSLAALVKKIIEEHGVSSVAICAPTGKAARRCSEVMSEYEIGITATTVHSMLGVMAVDNGNWSFEHNEFNTLPYEFIICDEVSMVGTGLMSSLLRAIGKGTCLLMVGDVNQLLPVEYGAPLRDMLPNIPAGKLDEIHRNAGAIAKMCKSVREGREFNAPQEFNDELKQNLVHIPAHAGEIQQKVLGIIKSIKSSGKYDPFTDIGVVVAVNKKSVMGREVINKEIQGIVNSHNEPIPSSIFRMNDKCMITKNSLFPSASNSELKIGCANGEFSKIYEMQGNKMFVELSNPTRRVRIIRGKSDGTDDENTGCDMVLGYAATCHKFQGSSSKVIIVVVDPYPGATGTHGICDRAWFYTGISRAEQYCYVVGSQENIDYICRRQFIDRRKTFMSELYVKALTDEAMLASVDFTDRRNGHEN